MLGTIGDLVEDVVVDLGGPINVASDTDAVVDRRRGGSAANVAVAAARISGRARFIGQVGGDPIGRGLVDQLTAVGVEALVRREGRTGTVVVLVHDGGERTMLSDRGACVDLAYADPTWLDGLHSLHVPLYSLADEPLASTSRALVRSAHERDMLVSVDASSTSLISSIGVDPTRALIGDLAPSVLFCNQDEAELLAASGPLAATGAWIVVARQGAGPASVIHNGNRTDVAAHRLPGVRDTTGAGDAFAAGFMIALADGADPSVAARAGHDSARDVIDGER